jgi:excisionase family DNA binding protein
MVQRYTEILEFLTVAEVAEKTRAPVSTVRHWIYTGRLKARKVGRRRLVEKMALVDFLYGGEGRPERGEEEPVG